MLNAIKRILIVIFGLFLQFGLTITVQYYFEDQLSVIKIVYGILSVLLVMFIVKNSVRLSKDLPWIIIILIFPIFGTFLYISLGRNYSKNKILKSLFEKEEEYDKYLKTDDYIKNELENKKLDNLKYIVYHSRFPVTKNNDITYYDFGEKFYPELLKELKAAEKYIFMEYFIINKGKMWNGILDILKEKASSGVEVRILYDDMGSLAMLSEKYPKELQEFGIKCIPFNKLAMFKGIFMNNRDHRKMTIIDGRVAFSGGVNLSDEYINISSRFGIWKDNGIKIVGDAVWNLTVMFLTMWNANAFEDANILKYKYDFSDKKISNGYVAPYGAAPLHKDLIGEDVYLNIINGAKEYVYIMTPYLIIDTDMVNSLLRAAKRGVDIRIITPGIPDKKIVYTLTTSFFKVLHEGGVKIYKYDPGFVHSKVFVSDDIRSVVGTINMDYRSLYLHFENGIYMEEVDEIKKVKKDIEDTLKECTIIDDKDVKVGILKNLWQAILRLFAPLF